MPLTDISEKLRRARRALESVPGYRLLRDWVWLPLVHRWALQFRLYQDVPAGSPVPAETDWVVTVSNGYPWGDITVFPAKKNGITETFPHQAWNDIGTEELPYRNGGLCLGIMTQEWQIRHGLSEPYTVEGRLLWHVERTGEWLHRACRHTLFQPGEVWEAPARAAVSGSPHIVVGRAGTALDCGGKDTHGIIELLTPQEELNVFFADRFIGAKEEALRAIRELGMGLSMGQSEWGHLLNRSSMAAYGIWIKLAHVPSMPYWRLPASWRELSDWYHEKEGSILAGKIADVLHRAGVFAERISFLLLGYPIPNRFEEQPSRMWWEACRLDGIIEKGVLREVPKSIPLSWANVYSNPEMMGEVRGQLATGLRETAVLMIGAGALGSILSELLVRGGLKQMCIMDSDTLHLGNLVRHTLTITDLGNYKAEAVARRLNASSLDAKVTAFHEKLGPATLPNLMTLNSDIVLDTTGSDQVLSDLAGWTRPTLLLSISLGLHARRIYAYAVHCEGFPVEDFHERIQPWLLRDREETRDLAQPTTDGIGCWSPVFPARLDDIYLLAAAAVKWIEEVSLKPPVEPILRVFELVREAGQFEGVRRVQ